MIGGDIITHLAMDDEPWMIKASWWVSRLDLPLTLRGQFEVCLIGNLLVVSPPQPISSSMKQSASTYQEILVCEIEWYTSPNIRFMSNVKSYRFRDIPGDREFLVVN